MRQTDVLRFVHVQTVHDAGIFTGTGLYYDKPTCIYCTGDPVSARCKNNTYANHDCVVKSPVESVGVWNATVTEICGDDQTKRREAQLVVFTSFIRTLDLKLCKPKATGQEP